jgi:hypothetical protein
VANETAVPLTEIGDGVDSQSGELAPAEWFR